MKVMPFCKNVGSVNETAVCEVMDEAFWKHYISYGGNQLRDTRVAATDTDDPAHFVIHGDDSAAGSTALGNNDRLQSQPNDANELGDDFNTDTINVSCGTGPQPWRALTASELVDLYQNTFLHEVAHGIGIEHDLITCSQSIMAVEGALPVVRHLTPNDLAQIRIHLKH